MREKKVVWSKIDSNIPGLEMEKTGSGSAAKRYRGRVKVNGKSYRTHWFYGKDGVAKALQARAQIEDEAKKGIHPTVKLTKNGKIPTVGDVCELYRNILENAKPASYVAEEDAVKRKIQEKEKEDTESKYHSRTLYEKQNKLKTLAEEDEYNPIRMVKINKLNNEDLTTFRVSLYYLINNLGEKYSISELRKYAKLLHDALNNYLFSGDTVFQRVYSNLNMANLNVTEEEQNQPFIADVRAKMAKAKPGETISIDAPGGVQITATIKNSSRLSNIPLPFCFLLVGCFCFEIDFHPFYDFLCTALC